MRALSLISGGLDSILAAKLIKDQGIEVIGIFFIMPFHVRKKKGKTSALEYARSLSAAIGIELKEISIDDEFFRMVLHPDHGYGKNMNPCIDCRMVMLRKAKELMGVYGASFIITGEVLGQRPMSQHRGQMHKSESQAGLNGLIVRPLSGKLLGATIPETNGWIKREQLLGFSGRERRPQIDLAVMSGITDFPYPAGGCLLTDVEFCRRLTEFLDHGGKFSPNEVALLKLGKVFRLADNARLVVGRDEEENELIAGLAHEGDYLFMPPEDVAGPTCLGRGSFTPELLQMAARICCSHCRLEGRDAIEVTCRRAADGAAQALVASPLEAQELLKHKV